MIEGKWLVSGNPGAFTWVRSTQVSDRTVVQIPSIFGVRFDSGATRSSGLDGFLFKLKVEASTSIVGIDISSASPTIRDFTVTGTVSGLDYPRKCTSIQVTGATSNPLIEGVSPTVPSIVECVTSSGSTNFPADIRGISISGGRAEISSITIRSLQTIGPNSSGVGLMLTDAAGTTLFNSSISMQGAVSCYGIRATGSSKGIDINTNTIVGCGINVSLPEAFNGYGVSFDACGVGGVGPAPMLRGNVIRGGAARTSIVGVESGAGCGLVIQGNDIIAGSLGNTPSIGYGVRCTNGAVNDPCKILANTRISPGTAGGGTTYGIACIGDCEASNASCVGSCAEISDNQPLMLVGGGILSGSGTTRTAIYVEQSSPLITRNLILGPAYSSSCTGIGINLTGSAARVINNGIQAPACLASYGMTVVGRKRADSSLPSPIVHSNTITAWNGSGTAPFTQVGIQLTAEGFNAGSLGVFHNNIIHAGPGNAGSSYAFEETSSTGDPVALVANDFWYQVTVGTAQLYKDEGLSVLSTATAINALSDVTVSGTQSVDPNINFGDFPHLQASSAVRGLGTNAGVGAPSDDYDGNPRDAGIPDIGADEVP